jgi:hypothetical protein
MITAVGQFRLQLIRAQMDRIARRLLPADTPLLIPPAHLSPPE